MMIFGVYRGGRRAFNVRSPRRPIPPKGCVIVMDSPAGIRDHLLRGWAGLASGRPRLVLGIGLALAIASVAWTSARLEFQTDRSRLMDADLPWNARYLDYKARFPRWGDLLVVVDAADADAEAAGEADGAMRPGDTFVLELAARLSEESAIRAVTAGYEPDPRYARLMLSLPEPAWAEVRERLRGSVGTAAAPSLVAWLEGVGAGLGAEERGTGADGERLAAVLARLADILAGRGTDRAGLVAGSGTGPDLPAGWVPLSTGPGGLRLVHVAVADRDDAITAQGAGIEVARGHVAELLARPEYAGIEAGVTGIPAIEYDETEQSIRDSTLASVVAAGLIGLLMVGVFRGITVPLLGLLALGTGVAWSFGWLTLAVGHLQVLSVVFTVILLGLGIDFALHLMARLELDRGEDADFGAALARAYVGVGPGVLTGALTTAAAFAITGLTDFAGVAEMGIIAGGGILLCLVAMWSIFPALVALLPEWRRAVRNRPERARHAFWGGRLAFVRRRPARVLGVAAILVSLAAGAGSRVRYDPNILNLHPPGIESVEWERRLVEASEQSAWSALAIAADLDEARQLAHDFLALEEVAAVDGVGRLFHPERLPRREMLADALPDPRVLDAPSRPGDPARAREVLALLAAGAMPAVADEAARALEMLDTVADPAEAWTTAERAYAGDRARIRNLWSALLDPAPPSLDDLPAPIRELDVGEEGGLLLRIRPASGEAPLLDPERLAAFVEAVESVDPRVLGPPVQLHESSRIIISAYVRAAIYAVAIILVLLLIDFRSPVDALLALAPVSTGFVGMFGVLAVVDVPLNFANIIVLPLIFGIGVDAGVHMVHRWRTEPRGRPPGLSGGTGRGITLTMISTMIGFGCMMLAAHRGIRGLGFTMTVGLGVTLLACYFVLPACLALRRTPAARPPRSGAAGQR